VVGRLPGGAYAKWSGTSMATPQVAAQAALIRARVPGLSRSGQLEAITRTTTSLRPLSVRYGAVDIPASLSYARKP
jgi:subtilisin family serine protease